MKIIISIIVILMILFAQNLTAKGTIVLVESNSESSKRIIFDYCASKEIKVFCPPEIVKNDIFDFSFFENNEFTKYIENFSKAIENSSSSDVILVDYSMHSFLNFLKNNKWHNNLYLFVEFSNLWPKLDLWINSLNYFKYKPDFVLCFKKINKFNGTYLNDFEILLGNSMDLKFLIRSKIDYLKFEDVETTFCNLDEDFKSNLSEIYSSIIKYVFKRRQK